MLFLHISLCQMTVSLERSVYSMITVHLTLILLDVLSWPFLVLEIYIMMMTGKVKVVTRPFGFASFLLKTNVVHYVANFLAISLEHEPDVFWRPFSWYEPKMFFAVVTKSSV